MDVSVHRRVPLVLSVAASCPHHQPTEFLAEPGVAPYLIEPRSTHGERLQLTQGRLQVPRGQRGVRYQVALGKMALEQDDFSAALQVGSSVLAPVYSWLLSPAGVPDETQVAIRWLGGARGHRFVTGLTPEGGGYVLRANEIKVATFGVFGQFREREFELPDVSGQTASIKLVTLDGSLAVSTGVLDRWVLDTAHAVAQFYGGFPVRHTMLAVAPVPAEATVVHGKVLPESSPGITIMLGSDTNAEQLYSDWILTHELFHLGFPSFVGEGKWLDEGLATYFEPLIRVRQGWISEEQVWAEFYHNMPRGLGVLERDGLEDPQSFRGMYWAGAIVCLLADVAVHRRSRLQRNLQQALGKLLRAGGDASKVWQLEHVIDDIDQSLGSPILAELSQRYRTPRGRVPLGPLFAALGVQERGDSISLDESAPLAHVRRAITHGLPAAP